MNDLGVLKNINNSDRVIQDEVISINFHCAKCGKFKKKIQTQFIVTNV